MNHESNEMREVKTPYYIHHKYLVRALLKSMRKHC